MVSINSFAKKTDFDGPNKRSTVNDIISVNLLSFNSAVFPDKIELSWSTAGEINNDHFILEQSQDGNVFIAVAVVKGAGTSSVKNDYKSFDYFPQTGISYYRLKETDQVGNFVYSDIIPVAFRNNYRFNILSVESTMHNSVKVFFTADASEKCELRLCELDGKTIMNMNIKASPGLNQKEIFTGSTGKGIYMMIISNDDGILTKKYSFIE